LVGRTLARFSALGLLLGVGVLPTPLLAEAEHAVTLVVATPVRDSGLLAAILPRFSVDTGIAVQVVAAEVGRALRLGEDGDADVLLLSDLIAAGEFVAAGHGVLRREVMHSELVIVGPASDPAQIRGLRDAVGALARIAQARAPFVSRGDDGDVHRAERRLWKAVGFVVDASVGTWYRETGTDMGTALNTAVELGAYTLCDRASWLGFRNKQALNLLVEGDRRLRQPFALVLVNPALRPSGREAAGRSLIRWLLSRDGQLAIRGYALDGEVPFLPSADDWAS